MNTGWTLKDGRVIDLLTIDQLEALPPDVMIYSIMGESRLVHNPPLGPPDTDTRGGLTAWGLLQHPPSFITVTI
jgi:hypothetical protein